MDEATEAVIRTQAKRDGITHLSTGVAIIRDHKILLVRRAKDDYLGGVYELPGGGVDDNETLTAAALREAEEETGLVPTNVLASFAGFDYSTDKKPKVRQINFLIEVESGEIVLSAEHDAYLWTDGTDLNDIEITEPIRTAVNQAFAAANSRN